MRQEVIHYPRLDTVIMVEEKIKEAKNYPSRAQLWKNLPRKTMYQTFSLILEYLEKSNKILVTKDGKVMWIGGNQKLDDAITKGRRVR